MSREKYRSDQYFEEFIIEEEKRAAKFREAAVLLKGQEQIRQCGMYMAAIEKNILTAEYSRGASKEKIGEVFVKYLEALDKAGIHTYSEMVDVLSLAILLDCRRESLRMAVVNTDFDDLLVLALKRYLAIEPGESMERGLLFQDHYGAFWEYLSSEGEGACEDFMKYMEDEWYPSCREMSWYEGHKSGENVYAGYWCWLAAALVKMKGDGMIVAGAAYIPADLI